MLNKDDTDISTDQVGYTVESAITLLGNAFAQMSMLCRQKVLEEYNKELLMFAQGEKQSFSRLHQNCSDRSSPVMPLST